MGKGSSRRPTDTSKFDNNYEAIFGKKKPVETPSQEELEQKHNNSYDEYLMEATHDPI
jgi:hypothetical protein